MQDSPVRSALILGARGRLGLAATRAFAAAGWRVLAQVRPGARPPAAAGVTWLPLAVEDTQALVRSARGAGVVVHAINPPYTRWDVQALPLLDAALRVAGQLQACLMLPGNVYNFGANMPALLLEHTPQLAHTRKGRIRVAMEQHMQQAAQRGDARSVVIRAGDFFGAGSGSWFDLVLAKDIERGKMTYPGAPDIPTAWAYLPDLAQAFERVAAKLLAAPGGLAPFAALHFHGHQLSGRDWALQLTDIARHRGWLAPARALKIATLPWPMIRLGGLVVPMWRELAEMRYLWQTPHALAGDKLAALIGAEPHTPFSDAVRAALLAPGRDAQPAPAATSWA